MKISIIGFGTMGQAIVRSINLHPQSHTVVVCNTSRKHIKFGTLRLRYDQDYASVSTADIVIIAVKPQDLATLGETVRGKMNNSAILISIAAGVTIKKLNKIFAHSKIIRLMPNLGLTINQGIAAWNSKGLTSTERGRAKKLLNEIVENFEVKNEEMIDTVTAISGSGLAYFFYFAKGLFGAAQSQGLSREQSRLLVSKTFSAAADLQTKEDFDSLIKKVASKKGTTEAALGSFNRDHLPEIVGRGVKAAINRAKELNHD